jgi:hypothetical protein
LCTYTGEDIMFKLSITDPASSPAPAISSAAPNFSPFSDFVDQAGWRWLKPVEGG